MDGRHEFRAKMENTKVAYLCYLVEREIIEVI